MISYACLDTHYLLPLYDRMRVELLSRAKDSVDGIVGDPMEDIQDNMDLLSSVLEEGKNLCMRLYTKKELCDSFQQDTNFRFGPIFLFVPPS